jgi:large subunit ribosomal protein L13
MKTYMANPATVERKWYVVDATDMPLGRLASQVADILTGKNKTIYTPHVDTGDFVIVVNSDKVVLTGKKLEQKTFRCMLPKNSIGRKQITRLHVYKDANHNHEAQKPEVVTLKGANE